MIPAISKLLLRNRSREIPIPPIPTNPTITMSRGADTKSGAGGVNIGALLPFVDERILAIVATTSSYTLISGTSGHWNIPTNGTVPTPTSSGVSNRLNGGPYIFNYSMSDGTTTYTGQLTITRDLGRSLPAYTYWRAGIGHVTVNSETFTNACYTVSNTAEFNDITTTNRSGATILIAKGAVPEGLNLTSFNRSPTNPCLVTSEDSNRRAKIGKLITNQGGKHRYSKLELTLTASELSSLFTNSICLSVQGGASDVRIMDCRIGARDGTASNNLPLITILASSDTHIIDSQFINYQDIKTSALIRPVFAHLTHERFSADAFFFGTTNNELNSDGTFDDILIGRGVWDGSGVHPDTGQFHTTFTANQGAQFSGTWSISDVRVYLADSDTTFNGFMFTGSGTGVPKLQGSILQYGCVHSNLTTYAMGHISNADYSASVITELWSSTAIRQLTGVTGSNADGKGSGAQGFDTWSDDGTTPVPANNQRYPGHKQTASWSTGCNYKIRHSYFDGEAPALVSTMEINTSIYKGRTPTSTNPVGMTPVQINDNSIYFSDPNRVVSDWSPYTMKQIDLIYGEMYRAKIGGPLDNGDGTFKGRWLPNGKINQLGRSTLSIQALDGTVTVSLSVSLSVDITCTIKRNGSTIGTIVIPTGSTNASANIPYSSGDTLIADNDCGLPQPFIMV